MKLLDIGEVAARTGIRPSALRYYEKAGLIRPVARHGLRRQYGSDVLFTLRLIAMGQTAGFSLEEIGSLTGRSSLPRERLHEKADELDRKIQALIAISNTLRHVADCRETSQFQCPVFLRLMAVSGAKRKKTGVC